MRKAGLILAFLLFTGMATGLDYNSTISRNCPLDYEPVISMEDPSKKYNNPGPPGMYDYNMCVEGLREAEIGVKCEYGASFYLSSNTTTAHFSSYPAYNLKVCTEQLITELRDSCKDNQTDLFSVSSDYNAHVAAPGVFDTEVCGFFGPKPENITLRASFNLSDEDKVYFDNKRVRENTFYLAEFPYIVSSSDEFVSGIVAPSFISASRHLDKRNTLSFTRQRESASFIVPLTRGDRREIENRQRMIIQKKFLNSLRPSFGFYMPEEATVRTILKPRVNITSSLRINQGTYTLEIKKTGENSIEVRRR